MEESKEVNRDEVVDKMASGDGTNSDVKTTSRKNRDSDESQPHQRERWMDSFTLDLTGVTMAMPVFQARIGQADGFCHRSKSIPRFSVKLCAGCHAVQRSTWFHQC